MNKTKLSNNIKYNFYIKPVYFLSSRADIAKLQLVVFSEWLT